LPVPGWGQRVQHLGVDERQHFRRIREMPGLALVLGDLATDQRHQPLDDLGPLGCRCGFEAGSTKHRFFASRLQPIGRPLDDAQCGEIAALGRVIPGEQPMAAEHHTDHLGVLGRHGTDLQSKVESGPLPRQIADLVAIDLARQLFGIRGGGNRDHGIGVHMINMRIGHKPVQRRINGGCARIEIERAMIEQLDHLVFVRDAPVQLLQPQELIHVERREPIQLHGPDIAARSLHPQDLR
jgi:hypothetical protein